MMETYHVHIRAFELAQPAWLIAAAILPLMWYAWRRGFARSSGPRSWLALIVRLLLFAMLILALADLTFRGSTDRQAVVAAIDYSLSTRSVRNVAEAYCRELARAAGHNRLWFLPFGAGPETAWPDWPVDPTSIDPVVSDPRASDPGAAITAARKLLPADYVPQIVLLTDGNETRGDLRAAAARAGVPISVVPLDGLAVPEVYVAALGCPEQVRQHEAIALDVYLYSNHADRGTVRLDLGSQTLARQAVTVAPGENRFHFSPPASESGRLTCTVRIEGFQDTILENNRASATVFVGPPPRVLLVEGQPDAGRQLAESLGRARLGVDRVLPQSVPQRLDQLGRYDALLLANAPATLLSPAALECIGRYVRGGRGGRPGVYARRLRPLAAGRNTARGEHQPREDIQTGTGDGVGDRPLRIDGGPANRSGQGGHAAGGGDARAERPGGNHRV